MRLQDETPGRVVPYCFINFLKHVLPNTERQQIGKAAFLIRKKAAGCFTEAPQLGTENRKLYADASHFTLYFWYK